MAKQKIEPCPLCGGEAKVKKYKEFPGGYYIECTECHSSSDRWGTRKDAIEEWNDRVEGRSIFLKSCPLCGGSACLYEEPDHERNIFVWQVECEDCEFSTPLMSREDAINLWNGDKNA